MNAKSSGHFLHGTFLDDGGVDGFCWRVQSETLVRETHLLCERGVGLPGGGVASVDLFHHLVDLFERETFGFRLECGVLTCVACQERISETYDKEVGKGRRNAAKGTPEEEDLSTEVRVTFVGTDQVRGNDGNDLRESARAFT